MIFYEVELLSLPEFLFAHSVETKKYRNSFRNRDKFIEISVCEQGHIIFDHHDKEKEIATPGMLVPILKDTNCETYSYENDNQCHTTVGVRAKYNLTRYESVSECDANALAQRIKRGNIVLIPHFFELGEKNARVLSIIKKIVSHNFDEMPETPLLVISLWYKLCAVLTEITYTNIVSSCEGHKPSEQLYVKKAIEYIKGINKEGHTVKEIAANLNISEAYLHRIFKKTMNCTIGEYVNVQRVVKLTELVENKNLTLYEAAYNVGIEDPAYASRLFKKVTGLSFREYFAVRM